MNTRMVMVKRQKIGVEMFSLLKHMVEAGNLTEAQEWAAVKLIRRWKESTEDVK